MQYEAGLGFGRDWGGAFAHAPTLQEFGDRSIRNRIQSRDGKRICACWFIPLVVCVCVRVCLYLHISVRAPVNAWDADPHAQPGHTRTQRERERERERQGICEDRRDRGKNVRQAQQNLVGIYA